jgi:hypothetical protein
MAPNLAAEVDSSKLKAVKRQFWLSIALEIDSRIARFAA